MRADTVAGFAASIRALAHDLRTEPLDAGLVAFTAVKLGNLADAMVAPPTFTPVDHRLQVLAADLEMARSMGDHDVAAGLVVEQRAAGGDR